MVDGGVGFALGSGVPGVAGGVGTSWGLGVSAGRGASWRAQPPAVIKTTAAARETGFKFIASPTGEGESSVDSLCGAASSSERPIEMRDNAHKPDAQAPAYSMMLPDLPPVVPPVTRRRRMRRPSEITDKACGEIAPKLARRFPTSCSP